MNANRDRSVAAAVDAAMERRRGPPQPAVGREVAPAPAVHLAPRRIERARHRLRLGAFGAVGAKLGRRAGVYSFGTPTTPAYPGNHRSRHSGPRLAGYASGAAGRGAAGVGGGGKSC